MDDQNKSNKITSQKIDFGESTIAKIGRYVESTTIAEQRMLDRLANANKQMKAISALPEKMVQESKIFSRIKKSAPETARKAEEYLEHTREARIEKANIQASSAISREYQESRIGGLTEDLAKKTIVQNKAIGMSGIPYEELEQQRGSFKSKIQKIGKQSETLASDLFSTESGMDPVKKGQLDIKSNVTAKLAEQLATVEAAMRLQQSVGLDPKSKTEAILSSKMKAEGIIKEDALRKEITETGGVKLLGKENTVKRDEAQKYLLSESDNLKKAFEELTAAVSKGEKDLSSYNKRIEEGSENIDKLSKLARSDADGGGGASRSQWASAAAGGFGAIGSGVQQVMVNQRLQQMGNISGFGNIENQKYDMYKAGRSGDVMSQMLLSGFGTAEKFGRELATGQGVANTAYLAGGVAQTAAGGFQMTEGAIQKNPVSEVTSGLLGNAGNATAETLSGATNVMQGVSTTAVTGFDIGRKISTSQAQIQGTQANIEAQRAMLAIPAQQLQGFRDYGVGLSVAAQGMGSRGGAFLEKGMSSENLQKMVNSRLSPEQMAQMSQVGVQQMGSQFNQEQIFAARNLEKSGYGPMAENMQRMATLAQAGSNNPQAGLASVMEAALTKGLDSSKALNLVAEHTGALVQASTTRAMGFDSTAAAASIATAAINKSDPNQEFAAQRAMQVQDLVSGIGTDVGTNFAAMAATARISKTTGLGGEESIIAQGLSDVDLKTMREEKDQSKVAEKLRMRGINVKGGDEAKKLIDTLTEDRLTTTLGVGGTGMATGAQQYAGQFAKQIMKDPNSVETLIEARRSGKYESKDQEAYLRSAATAAGLKGVGVDEYLRGAAGIVSKNDPNAIKSTKTALEGEGGSKELQSLDKLRTSGFAQLSDAALQATKSFEKLGGALKVLSAMNEKMESFGKTGGEAKFATAAVDSAASFGKHTVDFGVHVGEFGKWIMELNSKAGIGDKVNYSDSTAMQKLINSNYNTRKDSSSRGH
jgi:hypothetical protein